MKNKFLVVCILCISSFAASSQKTPFEKDTNVTATYEECIAFYEALDKKYASVEVKTFGETDGGEHLQLVTITKDGNHNPSHWKQTNKMVILINNGIHPGEPDGIDASMMLARDMVQQKNGLQLPSNIVLCIIPVFNIAGCKLRSAYHRPDQNGPAAFGERGNAQNLDLNRDFIKCDSKDAQSFTTLFHYVKPAIFIDNHVSDGADYAPIITLATTQHNKLGGFMETYLQQKFEPALYEGMLQKKYTMIPYVNVWGKDAKHGWNQFFDAPRYSSGYACLWNVFSFTVETHMLKPYIQRVWSTYHFMEVLLTYASLHQQEIQAARRTMFVQQDQQTIFPLTWKIDTSKFTLLDFEGYAYKEKLSDVSGLPIFYYDKKSPYTEKVKFYDTYVPVVQCTAPIAYVIPKHCWKVVELLKMNDVAMDIITKDTLIDVEVTKIMDYKSGFDPYEGHHPNHSVKIDRQVQKHTLHKGDYIVFTKQDAKRFIIEVLEPQGMDSYFTWNYFDAFLIQKEGYSDYAFEEIAANFLEENPSIKVKLKEACLQDSLFAKSASDQLDFVYMHSPYVEKRYKQYPIFRLLQKEASLDASPSTSKEQPVNKKDE